VALIAGLSVVHAQPLSSGVALRDSSGTIWLLVGASRTRLTVIGTSDDHIATIPEVSAVNVAATPALNLGELSTDAPNRSTPELHTLCAVIADRLIAETADRVGGNIPGPGEAYATLVERCMSDATMYGARGVECFEQSTRAFLQNPTDATSAAQQMMSCVRTSVELP